MSPRPAAGAPRVSPVRPRARWRTKAVTQHTRLHNRALILQTLYTQGPMSRSDLGRASKLTAPTVSALVAELEADGLVSDIGFRGEPRIGKPATVVQIEDDAVLVIALDLSGADRFTGALINMRGRVVARDDVPASGVVGDAAVDLVFELIETLRSRADRPILGIGVGSPGIIDDAGVVRQAINLSWTDLPMVRLLTERTDLPTYVGNDVNVEALGVHHFDLSSSQDLIVVSIEHGVGVGMVVGGRLVEGTQFAAGEIGHITVVEDGEPCQCGRLGCLEVMVSATRLTRRYEQASDTERDTALDEAGHALGVVLAPIIGALNLREVVVTGPAGMVDGHLLRSAERTIRARIPPALSTGLSIRALSGESDVTLLGAAALVLSAELGVL